MSEQRRESALDRRDAEWGLLAGLCAVTLPAMIRAEYCTKLRGEAFGDLAHQVVFQEICAMSKAENIRSAGDLREHLAARVTARGFPDLEFGELLAGEEFSAPEALRRLQCAYERVASGG